MPGLALSLLMVFFAVLGVRAQDVLALAEMTSVFNLMVKDAYAGTNGFSARIIVSLGSVGQTPIGLPLTVRQSGSKLAAEYRFTDFGRFADQARQALRKLSVDEQVVVLDTKDKRIDILFPGIKGYIEMQSPPSLTHLIEEMQRNMERVVVGNEVWQEHTCEKVNLIDPGHTNVTASVWERIDLDHFPVKIELLKKDQPMTMCAESVELSRPSASIFEVPPGFTRYATYAEVTKAATRIAQEKAGPPTQDAGKSN